MRWLLWIVGALVALVAVYGVGAMLPAEHVARVERDIVASTDDVARRIRDVRGYERWRGVKVEVLSEEPGRTRYRETGGGDTITFELVEEPGGRRFTSTILDKDLAFDGFWTIELAAKADMTHIAVEEHGRVKDPIFRFLARFVFGYTATMESYLDALATDAQALADLDPAV